MPNPILQPKAAHTYSMSCIIFCNAAVSCSERALVVIRLMQVTRVFRRTS